MTMSHEYDILVLMDWSDGMGVKLNMFEEEKYQVIKKVRNDQFSKERAEVELNLSRRQVNRLLKAYKEKGKAAFLHSNSQRKPVTTIPIDIKENIVELYQTKYKSFNVTHFTEKLNEDEKINISYTTVRRLLFEKHLLSPRAQRKTKRAKREELKELEKNIKTLTEEETKILADLDPIDPEKAHPSKPRKKYSGELLQMDASEHDWFRTGKNAHLHGAIDNTTGTVVDVSFDSQETLNGYYEVTRQFLTTYGIPYELLTDNRTVFHYESEKNSPGEKSSLTQYGYACQTLGIKLSTTSVPEAKGQIERLWNTFQDRLLNEMALKNIQSIDEANEFLKSYLPKYNRKFASPIKDTKTVFEKLPQDTNLKHILARFSERVIHSGHIVKFQNKQYHLYNKHEKILLPKKTKVMIIETLDNQLYVSHRDEIFALKEIPSHEVHSKAFDEPKKKPKVNNQYIPPMTHPWKKASYERYLRKEEQKKKRRKTVTV